MLVAAHVNLLQVGQLLAHLLDWREGCFAGASLEGPVSVYCLACSGSSAASPTFVCLQRSRTSVVRFWVGGCTVICNIA